MNLLLTIFWWFALFNEEDIQLRKPQERDYLEFRELVKRNLSHINTFLDWDPLPWHFPPWYQYSNFMRFVEARDSVQMWMVTFKEEIIGFAYMSPGIYENAVQIAGWGSKEFSGQGIGTRILKALIYKAFKEMDFKFVEVHTDKENQATKSMIYKLNFTNSGFTYEADFESQLGSGVMEVWILPCPEIRIFNALDKTPIGRIMASYVTGRHF